MDNSHNDSNRFAGNLPVVHTKPKILPIRIKDIDIVSDDDESEENKVNESESESDSEDFQLLPDDDDEEESNDNQDFLSPNIFDSAGKSFSQGLTRDQNFPIGPKCVDSHITSSVKGQKQESNSELGPRPVQSQNLYKTLQKADTLTNKDRDRDKSPRSPNIFDSAGKSLSQALPRDHNFLTGPKCEDSSTTSSVKGLKQEPKSELGPGPLESQILDKKLQKADTLTNKDRDRDPFWCNSNKARKPVEIVLHQSETSKETKNTSLSGLKQSLSEFSQNSFTGFSNDFTNISKAVNGAEEMHPKGFGTVESMQEKKFEPSLENIGNPDSEIFESKNVYRKFPSESLPPKERQSSYKQEIEPSQVDKSIPKECKTSGMGLRQSSSDLGSMSKQLYGNQVQEMSAGYSCNKEAQKLVPLSSHSDVASHSAHGHVVMDTPLKHQVAPGSMRPVPSYSHRQIFQTPQNKVQSDFVKSSVKTPATIFSHWSEQKHMFHTPLQKAEVPEQIPNQVPRRSGSSSASKSILSDRYCGKDEKDIRRPLAESTKFAYNESKTPSHQLENQRNHRQRSHYGSLFPPVPEVSSQRESNSKIENVPANTNNQLKYSKSLSVISSNLEAKENHRLNSIDLSTKNDFSKKYIVVNGRKFLILGQLGQGMAGSVIRVQDLSNSELRAIKCVDLSKMDKESAQGCIDEITRLKELQAPTVVTMFDYQIDYPMIYVVMEMGDTDLSRFIKSRIREEELPFPLIFYFWMEMLAAVKYIHSHGVIHSDLKPSNFLLVRGRLKLIDFGISSSMNGEMTSVVKHDTVGTLNYISPEALTNISNSDNNKYKITFKSDVWSLGIILYSLIYGYTPFQSIRPDWVKVQTITDPKHAIAFPTSSKDGGRKSGPPPLTLIEVVRKCLQRDPKARPTVDELLQIPYLTNETTHVSKKSPKISPKLIAKIKRALSEEEWRQFTEELEGKR